MKNRTCQVFAAAAPPSRSDTTRRWCVWSLVALLVLQGIGCAGGGRVISTAKVTSISPWRYLDLWQALRVGRGVLVGMADGGHVAGDFVSGGGRTILLQTSKGRQIVKIANIKYVVNVIDLHRGRDGALAGGLIGLGTGLSIAYMSRSSGSTAAAPTARLARGADDEWDSGDSASTGDSESSDSESSSGTTPEASSTEGGESSTNDGYDAAGGASSESSSGGDPTETGSSTYEEGSSAGSSTGSGATGSEPGSQGSSSDGSSSSEGSSTVVVVASDSDDSRSGGSSSGGGSDPSPAPANATSGSQALRTFYYTVAFSAIGAVIGWAIGRSAKRSTPRVDYVLFPENLDDRKDRSPDQYLADQMVTPTGESPTELLEPGSRFDSPRSARVFDNLVGAEAVRLAPGTGSVITAPEAASYKLFTTVDDFFKATIVQVGSTAEREGTETRYLAVVTTKQQGAPIVDVQRLDARDVITISTQIALFQSGILP
jgi:hypothetical protein